VPFDLVFEIEDTGFTVQFYPEVQFLAVPADEIE
jgi:hypothetical protein